MNNEDKSFCTWTQVDYMEDSYHTSCNNYFTINDGTPTDNKLQFCCYCGKPLIESLFESKEEEDGR